MCRSVNRRVYLADVSALMDAMLFQYYYKKMPSYRQDKIDRLRFQKDRCLSLGAGVLLEIALANAKLRSESPEIAYRKQEKPFFPTLPEFHFNLSHSGTKVMCAVADREIGCDVEKTKAFQEKIAERFFHPLECQTITAENNPMAQRDLFYRLWTIKESFLKATGLGLSFPLNAFSVSVNGNRIEINQTVDSCPYGIYEFFVDKGYTCACCIREDNGNHPPELIQVDLRKDRSL